MYNILSFYSPEISIHFGENVNNVHVNYYALFNDKKNHLYDLRIYYIDLVQKKLINDNTISDTNNVTLNVETIQEDNIIEVQGDNDESST